MQQNKIELYVVRDFGQKFSDTFGFIRQNWRTLFRFMLYLILPLCLLQSVGLGQYLDFTARIAETGNDTTGIVSSLAIFMLTSMVGSMVFFSMCYGLMKVYDERRGDLSALTMKEFVPYLRRNIGRLLLMGLVSIGLMLLMVLIVAGGIAVSPWLGGLLVIVCMLAAFPMMLWPAIYLLEDDVNVFEALAKSYRLSLKTFGGLLVFTIVMSTACYFIVVFPMVIMAVLVGLKATFVTGDFDGLGSMTGTLLDLGTYLWGIVASFITYAGYVPFYIGLAYQYGHAAEKVDSVSVKGDIERFEEMADRHEDVVETPVVDDFDKL